MEAAIGGFLGALVGAAVNKLLYGAIQRWRERLKKARQERASARLRRR